MQKIQKVVKKTSSVVISENARKTTARANKVERTPSKSLRRPSPQQSQSGQPSERKSSKRKDPTDALGSFISFLDTEKIENDVDFIDIDAEIRRMLDAAGNDCCKLVSEESFVHLCKAFDLKIRELMSMMMERYPEQFGVPFMKSEVRPFVVGLIRERNEYRNGTAGFFNKPIFSYL